MKKIQKLLKGHKHICFLDFEGTQFSHEMIAFGAVFVTLDKNNNVKTKKNPIKFYVKAKNNIGKVVEKITGITQKDLDEKGVSFATAMKEIKKYCGMHFKAGTSFITFGNHDMRIISQSFAYNLDAPGEITSVIQKNYIDLQFVISEFVKGEDSNPLSLEKYLEVFGIPFEGTAHDPMYDALNLMYLYKAFMERKDVVLERYLMTLSKTSHLPEPIFLAVKDLASGKDVTATEFKKNVEEYIK